jgi:hypothetical protein
MLVERKYFIFCEKTFSRAKNLKNWGGEKLQFKF